MKASLYHFIANRIIRERLALLRIHVALLVAIALATQILGSSCSQGDKTTATPIATGIPASSPPVGALSASDLCARARHAVIGKISAPDLVEISGLVASRTQDVVWAHNDSGDTARVFALSSTGDALATYEIRSAEAIDWEDMALGPGPDSTTDYLYLADIGDNASIRPAIAVYRAPEPVYDPASSLHAIEAERLTLVYPDGAHDAETFLVDPRTGDLIVITKNIAGGASGVYTASAPLDNAGAITLAKEGEIDFGRLMPVKVIPEGSGALPSVLGRVPTGGDISPDGNVIAVRTYGTVWLWQRDNEAIVHSFTAAPCEGPSEVESQGEAIAFLADGRGYLTASEGQNVAIHRFSVDSPP